MSTLRVIVVEDIQSELDNLLWKLQQYCPLVEVIAQCRTGNSAVEAIHQQQPDLVLLDINLGTMSGFDVLDRVLHIHFEVIFTTGHDEYAIRAIKAGALDYLLKPIDKDELISAITKVWRRLSTQPAPISRIVVPVEQSLHILELSEIVYCEADNNHTLFHFSDPRKDLRVKRTLGDIEEKMPRQQFFRIHRSYLVNRDYLKEVDRGDGGWAVMKSGKKLSISPQKKEILVEWLMGR